MKATTMIPWLVYHIQSEIVNIILYLHPNIGEKFSMGR